MHAFYVYAVHIDAKHENIFFKLVTPPQLSHCQSQAWRKEEGSWNWTELYHLSMANAVLC